MRPLVFWALLMFCQIGSAQEALDFWMRSTPARGRVQILATDAAQLQILGLWSERSLKQLETDWQTALPFRQGQPLQLQIHADGREPELVQAWRQRVLLQVIHLSENSMRDQPQQLAELFTRAMATRRGLAAMPPEAQHLDWTVPDWLVTGSAHALLQGRSRDYFSEQVNRGPTYSPPYPEQISGGNHPAAAALLCRWLFQQNPAGFWSALTRGEFRAPESWVAQLPRVGNLRELHLQWDLWWMGERQRLIADYQLQSAAEAQLTEALMFIPATYGMSVEGLDRSREIPFSQLVDYLDDPRFEAAMQKWVLRLHRLRFRQNEAFNNRVERIQQAGNLAIQAARSQGRKRERIWGEAVAKIAQ